MSEKMGGSVGSSNQAQVKKDLSPLDRVSQLRKTVVDKKKKTDVRNEYIKNSEGIQKFKELALVIGDIFEMKEMYDKALNGLEQLAVEPSYREMAIRGLEQIQRFVQLVVRNEGISTNPNGKDFEENEDIVEYAKGQSGSSGDDNDDVYEYGGKKSYSISDSEKVKTQKIRKEFIIQTLHYILDEASKGRVKDIYYRSHDDND